MSALGGAETEAASINTSLGCCILSQAESLFLMSVAIARQIAAIGFLAIGVRRARSGRDLSSLGLLPPRNYRGSLIASEVVCVPTKCSGREPTASVAPALKGRPGDCRTARLHSAAFTPQH